MKSDIDFSKIYSFSKLEMFNKCKKQYHFFYLDPEISPRKKEFIKPRDYKTKGQAVHGAITLFYYLPKNKRTPEKLEKFLYESWFSEKDITKAPPLLSLGGFDDVDHERKIYKECLVLLNNFIRFKDIDPKIFYLPKKDIKNSFDDYKEMIKPLTNGYSISGKFDRIDKEDDNTLRIIDFKTGKNENGHSQLEFYKLLAELNFNEKVNKVSFYYLDSPKIVNYDFTNKKTEDIKEDIIRKIEEINNTKDFYPRKNRYCSHCDFKEICPLFK